VNQNRNSGFTLIEMVISLTLLSFIIVIGYQGLTFSVKQWRNGHNSMLFQYDYHQAVSWIRHKVGASENVKKALGSDYVHFFTGNRDSVEFVARYNRTRRGGLYVNKIIFNENDKNIYVTYYLFHPDIKYQAKEVVSEQVALLSNVKSTRFSYYGKKKGKLARWYGSWKDADSLPQLLKVDIETATGERYQSTIHVATSNNA